MNFSWTGIDISGNKKCGHIISENKKSAELYLKKNNIILLSIKREDHYFSFQKKFSRKDLFDFTQELYLLLKSGVSLKKALDFIMLSSKNDLINQTCEKIKEYIISGKSLSDSLSCFPQYFDKTYCKLISAGERSGQLDIVLKQIIYSQFKFNQIRKKIAKAFIYPTSILISSIFISIGLMLFVIPQFASIYSNFGSSLPKITQNLIFISHALTNHFIFFIITLFFIFFLIKMILKQFKNTRYFIDQLKLNTPFLKNFFIQNDISRWSSVFSILLGAGVPLTESFFIANQTIDNIVFKKCLDKSYLEINSGSSFCNAIENVEHIPTRAKQLIHIGENADSLRHMMDQVALVYFESLNDLLDHLSKLLEPVMMILIAILITGLIMAIYLPIFQMGNIV